jgi:hypothetical protein
MGLARVTTERTHDNNGALTMSELHRRERATLDSLPMATSCSVYGCDWTHEGTAAEGRDAHADHRLAEHPTAERARRGLERFEVSEREPKADETPTRSPGADARAHEPTPVVAPSPGPAGTEPGSRPMTIAQLFAIMLRLNVDTLEELAIGSIHDGPRLRDVAGQLRAIADWMEGGPG